MFASQSVAARSLALWGDFSGGASLGITERLRSLASTRDPESDWTPVAVALPNFCLFGFHTGRKVWVRLKGGHERRVIYQGYGIFGRHWGLENVTHWRPA